MSKHHPPRGHNHRCATECPQDEKCGTICGEFRFTAPTTVYSFNADDAHPVYQIVDGVEHPVGVFGGKAPFQRKFDICGEYVIRWCVRGEMPDCEVEEPVFYQSNCGCPPHIERRDVCISYQGKHYFGYQINCLSEKETRLIRYEWIDYSTIPSDLDITVNHVCDCDLLFIKPEIG